MRLRLSFGMAVALLASATAVFAYPNLNATTGLIGVPNAYVVPSGSLVGAADGLFFDDTLLNVRALWGLSNKLEAGVGGVFGNGSGLILNAKYRFAGTVSGFNVAAGAGYQSADVGNGFQVYAVGTAPIINPERGMRLLGSLGVNFTDMEDASAIRPFVGAELLLSPRTEIGGEFMLEAGDFDNSISSLYIRQRFTSRWAAQAGFTNANGFVGQDDHDFFVGAAYTLSGPATTVAGTVEEYPPTTGGTVEGNG